MIERLPQRAQTPLGRLFKDGLELSEGQWQRIALARGFLRPAPILMLDEPTSSLDAKAERDLLESVASGFRGKTVLVVSHRLSTVRMADRILMLSEGSLVEAGSHDALVQAGGSYSKLFALHAT